MSDEKVVEITAELAHGPRYSRHVMDIKPKRRKPNHKLIAEAEADANEFALKAGYWMRVAVIEALVLIPCVLYIAFDLS